MYDIIHWLMPSGLLDQHSPFENPVNWIICLACLIILRQFLLSWFASCLVGFVYRIILSEVDHVAGRAPINDLGDFLQVLFTCAAMLALLKAALSMARGKLADPGRWREGKSRGAVPGGSA